MQRNPQRSVRDFLVDSPWMRRLDYSTQEKVIGDSYDVMHRGGDVVAREGEPVSSWIGVADGILKVVGGSTTRRPVIYSSVPAGSWMGEGSVLKDEPRHYDVIAISSTRTIHVPRTTFHWLLETSFEFNHFIIQQLNERLGQFMSMTESQRIENPTIRLARALVGLFNPVIYPRTGTVVNTSQQELGELAGLTRQRVNAAIQVLKTAGVLNVQYGSIVVIDLPGLKLIANAEDA